MAFGSDVALALLQIDPRRRPRTALPAARILGADVEEYALAGSAVLTSPPPPTPTAPADLPILRTPGIGE